MAHDFFVYQLERTPFYWVKHAVLFFIAVEIDHILDDKQQSKDDEQASRGRLGKHTPIHRMPGRTEASAVLNGQASSCDLLLGI